MICWHTAAVDDDSQNHETNAGNDFHGAENKLDLIRLGYEFAFEDNY